ncbi:YbjQ family protein [Parvularcula sp. LCG005]|uniref:YbjQ family protein n=1 Tax=Parvularcula sp. LCG005 TaxID=3078805 RepID=UPI002943213B|nr:YbjQ family protein [Parvularcula sp. LCG005]WOI52876.1 YbjQ family protein [Parvularcula sp. LCG005]
MIVTTTETVGGRTISESLGVCRGNVIRARHVGNDIVAGLRNIVGGEVNEYTKLMAEARQQAYDRMLAHAEQMGADAVVGMRFTTSTITQGAAEILAFGTAVKLAAPAAADDVSYMKRG